MKRVMRKFEPAFKARIAVEAIKGQKTVAEISSAFGVHSSQIAKWKKLALDDLPKIFAGSLPLRLAADDTLVASLYQQIGQQKVELDWFKKKSELLT